MKIFKTWGNYTSPFKSMKDPKHLWFTPKVGFDFKLDDLVTLKQEKYKQITINIYLIFIYIRLRKCIY